MSLVVEQRVQVRISSGPDLSIIEARGELDRVAAPRLAALLTALAGSPDVVILLDLRRITYLSPEGILPMMQAIRGCGAPPSCFEVQVIPRSQPEQALRDAGFHLLVSVVLCDAMRTSNDCSRPGLVELRLPSDVCQVGRVRSITEQTLLLAGADEGWLCDFVVAVGEAVANAVTHGSPPGGAGYATFLLTPGEDHVVAEVQDYGTGIKGWDGHPCMPPPESLRGRGLGMMEIFTDRMDVNTGSQGTLIRLRKNYGWV